MKNYALCGRPTGRRDLDEPTIVMKLMAAIIFLSAAFIALEHFLFNS